MHNYTFDFEIQTLLTMFIHAMDDIVIKRYNVHKQPQDQLRVRFVYAPKQRVLNDLLNRDQNLQLPVVACYLGGIAKDQSRVFNKLQGTYTPLDSTSLKHEGQPLPIDITVNVSILTRYQSDMDQIITNILPYFDPYIVISWRPPNRPDFEIRSNVFWSNNISLDYPKEINASQNARIAADTSFTIKGWLFKSLDSDPIGTIFTINSTYGVDELKEGLYSYDRLVESYKIGDNLTIAGNPPQSLFVDPYVVRNDKMTEVFVNGRGFTKINNVYLSGDQLSGLSTSYNPFSATPLSASYPAFNAIKIPQSSWRYNNLDTLSFIFPAVHTSGFVDLIVEGPAGYGQLTKTTRKNTFNPYPVGSAEYNTYIPYQFPFAEGIKVV